MSLDFVTFRGMSTGASTLKLMLCKFGTANKKNNNIRITKVPGIDRHDNTMDGAMYVITSTAYYSSTRPHLTVLVPHCLYINKHPTWKNEKKTCPKNGSPIL